MTIEIRGTASRAPAARVRRLGRDGPPAFSLPVVALALKVFVVLSMVRAAGDPTWAHLEGKAPVARAVVFPLLVAAVPAFWAVTRRAIAYPWAADLVVTLACLADIAGNRLDLYDEVAWFDDAMHVVGTAAAAGVVVVLTVDRTARLSVVVNAAVAAGVTASLAWELFEYGSFLTRSTEWTTAYSDTIGDLTLGWLGSVGAVAVLVALRRHHTPGAACGRMEAWPSRSPATPPPTRCSPTTRSPCSSG